jgi:rhamnogalacturonyl hydrolase YesR
MRNIGHLYWISVLAALALSCTSQRKGAFAFDTSKEDVLAMIHNVNGYWQKNNPPQQRAFWDVAAYHTGNMAAYFLTKNEAYRKYSETWAEHNEWKGAKSNNKAEWKYSYGEKDDYVLFGDWQICFQTYIDLYTLAPEEKKIARAKEVMEYQMSTPRNDYWWWADGLYMVMPVMTKLHKITGNSLYLQKLHEYYSFANSIMYDSEAKLYYRDAKYVYPKHKTANGKKDFWARGDGWVFAGLAKVLADLLATDPHREEYSSRFKDMAIAIKAAQQPEGYWTRSMLDPQHAPGPETSGTAFFTYGLLWGVNNGFLDEDTYLPVVQKSWQYLTKTALQADGKIGYVQPIGERAIPGQVVDKNSTSNFGVGAFLLAACELYRHLDKAGNKNMAVTAEIK